MATDFVRIEKRGALAIVRFDRGDRLNAMSMALARELTRVAHDFRDDLDTTAIVVTGTPRAFCAGRDLRDPEIEQRTQAPMLRRRRLSDDGARLTRAWEELEQLTVCAVEGFAVGAGLALALAFDVRFMGAGAHFRAPEIALGLSMSWGSIPRLVNLVGPARAKQILINADDRISAEEAHAWGLVQGVAPDGEALDHAVRFAAKAAAMPPLTVRITKRTINAYANALAPLAVHMDTDQVILTETTADHREAVAAFKAKREPRFSGA
jgi:enoyl-CoA hydratase